MSVPRLTFLLFLAVQILDGVFTYVATSAIGPDAEANVVLAAWMVLVGPGPTLVVAKSVAAGAGAFLYRTGFHGVLSTLTFIYAVASIGPWLHVYRTWP
jgi:hypothetical protein